MGNRPAPAGPSTPGFRITAVYTMIGGDFKELKEQVKKKTLKNSRQAAIWLWRAVRKRIKRSTAKSQIKMLPLKLWHYKKPGDSELEEMQITPTAYMANKRSVAPDGGRGGRRRVEPVDQTAFRWNKVSKPGEGPLSHPANQKGWQDEWLRNSVLFDEKNGHILIYSNPSPPGKRPPSKNNPFGPPSKMYPRQLEQGGSVKWSRKSLAGFVILTIRQGVKARQGDGKTIVGKKQNDGQYALNYGLTNKGGKRGRLVNKNALVNRSGQTRKTHKRKFRQPHVALRPEYRYSGGSASIQPRPFMAPVQAAFFRDYFPELYKNLMEK